MSLMIRLLARFSQAPLRKRIKGNRVLICCFTDLEISKDPQKVSVFIMIFIYLSVYIYTSSIQPPIIYLSIYPSLHPFFHLSVCLSIYLSIPYIYPIIVYLSIKYPSIYASFDLALNKPMYGVPERLQEEVLSTNIALETDRCLFEYYKSPGFLIH